jgi:zinc transport system substrate-binding protein
MKKLVIPFVFLLLLGAGCVKYDKKVEILKENPYLVTSIEPIKMIVEDIAEGTVEVRSIVPPLVSPHDFELTPNTKVWIEESKILFLVGHEFDNFVSDVNSDKKKEVILDKYVSLRKYEEDSEHEDHEEEQYEEHEHGEYDPHYFLGIKNAEAMAKQITEVLANQYPENRELYLAEFIKFKGELLKVENEGKEKISKLQNKNIITFHDSFDYFANDLGINIVDTFESNPNTEPSAGHLKELYEKVKKEKVVAIFTEPALSSKTIETFLKDNNIKNGVLYPEGGNNQIFSYPELLKYNIDTIYNTLKNE